ncbi:hypothetical protein DRJ04_04350 [Candidatus Aerophobetes bacterium]|uniref:HTH cro/C1-type domain-containing protein n=1 Tax=Aerophobetes bacterium TaxID=2030807 RepID=A0A662DHM8_UNCAE|nr:MAG: hypothetical protein DRJ04_04350 [Candidatus Aerophobetes bacterium]
MDNPLKKYREKRKLKQLDLALLLGVSEMQISHWERGARIPPQEVINKLAEILKVDSKILHQELKTFHEQKRKGLKEKLGLRS